MKTANLWKSFFFFNEHVYNNKNYIIIRSVNGSFDRHYKKSQCQKFDAYIGTTKARRVQVREMPSRSAAGLSTYYIIYFEDLAFDAAIGSSSSSSRERDSTTMQHCARLLALGGCMMEGQIDRYTYIYIDIQMSFK